jgi:hypothetical protein
VHNFFCVGGDSYGCSQFTEGSGGKIVTVEEALASDPNTPLCWAGAHKVVLLEHCRQHNRTFYNLDTGYFGNAKRKEILRVSVNNLQDQSKIVDRPSDRLDRLRINIQNFDRGATVVIVPPDRKIARTCGLGTDWVEQTQAAIEKHTDRPVRIRHRPESRTDRIVSDSFEEFVKHDTHVVIGYSSNALVEAVLLGIPVIALGHSATTSLMRYEIKDIEHVPTVDQDLRYSWLKHLAYRQFTHSELADGTAWKLLAN